MKKISIVTPVYNSEKYLEKCILSIKNQSYENYEHIIVDGGSTDDTLSIIKRYVGTYNMRWISEKDSGMYDAICKGFAMATGEIFAWLNADDMYQPYAFEVMNRVVEKKECQWCTGIPVIYSENDIMYDLPVIQPINFRWLMKRGYPGKGGCGLQQESTFWTRQLWEKAKGNEIRRYKLAGDIILWKKFAQYSDLYYVNIIISGFRRHLGQKSEDILAYKKERGRWSIFNIILKVLHIPDILACGSALFGNKRVINYKDLF